MIRLKDYKDIQFPNDFLWGASTAGQQIEGNNCSFYDCEKYAPKYAFGGVPYEMANKACNSYEMYEEDIKLLKKMNLTLYLLEVLSLI